jgi:hypothetical protein
MIIRKKPARPHGRNEPFRHENHPRPVTRRQLLGAGFLSGPALVLAPTWLGALLKSQRAAAALDPGIQSMEAECKIQGMGAGAGPLPFITIDLAGGANLIGSEALAGVMGGQMSFLSSAGYSRLGLPGNMLPTSSTFVDTSLGLAFHSDSAILRGIKTKAQAATLAGVNGVVIPAMSQNDTGNNPLNAMYGIAKAAAGPSATTPLQYGSLLTLCGTQSSVSGGNSASPAAFINPTLQPTRIAAATDDTGLVSTSGSSPTPDTLAALASQARISSGTAAQSNPAAPSGTAFASSSLAPALIPGSNSTADAALKEQVRCAYVKSAFTADQFGNPSTLNPDMDPNIVFGGGGVFTSAEYTADSNLKKTAAVMKLVVNGFAGAGTITLGGYDYHDGTRANGEQKNFEAGLVIGAILDYARRVGRPVMIQVISDGSLNSTGMVDSSTNGRGKLGWQGDSQQTAASLILAYSPKGRPAMTSQQIGFMNADGTVNAMSSPAANANNLLVQTVMLNWMAANGTVADFATIFPMQGLGAPAARDAVTAFTKIT